MMSVHLCLPHWESVLRLWLRVQCCPGGIADNFIFPNAGEDLQYWRQV